MLGSGWVFCFWDLVWGSFSVLLSLLVYTGVIFWLLLSELSSGVFFPSYYMSLSFSQFFYLFLCCFFAKLSYFFSYFFYLNGLGGLGGWGQRGTMNRWASESGLFFFAANIPLL